MTRFPASDHFDGERFFNPHGPAARPVKDVVTWQRTRQRAVWPVSVALQPHAPPPREVPPGRVAVTFIGHSTFLLRTPAAAVITDPVFTTHAGPFGRTGPRRVRPPALGIADLPPLDLVLLSHNHYDHLQPSSLRAVARSGRPRLVTSLGLRPLAGSYGFRHATELDWWESCDIEGVARVTSVPAQHFSARTLWDRNRTLWTGFIVESGGATIYFAGDTGYSPDFIEIGRRFPRIDVALIPVGAYEPRWFMHPVHVNPEEAVRIHADVGARRSFGMHFGTFQLTDEGIDEPVAALSRARDAAGVSADAFGLLDFGETAIV
ncbi:MAG TPA: MBL fold metallo-hydrolase [Vicinamibacterales bacterium]|nr:MBL fold metallo-hydrolase [Vicinamibacterales bacterium]